MKKNAAVQQQLAKEFSSSSAMERVKLDFHYELDRQLKYRVAFLQKIKTFCEYLQ